MHAIGMAKFRGVGVLVLAPLLALVIAGCGSSNNSESNGSSSEGKPASGETAKSSEPTGKVTTIDFVSPAKNNDFGWNEQGYLAAKEVAEKAGAKLEVTADIGYEKTESVLTQLATKKPSLIIAHASGFDTPAERVAQQFQVPTITYDIPKVIPGVAGSIITEAQGGGYLAGVLAAKMTKVDHVGVIISANDANWFMMAGGFGLGVRSVNPKIKVSFAEIGPEAYDDTAGGKRVADSMMASGADVIFAMGDDASFGYLSAIETAKVNHKVWYIGDIGNMKPIDHKNVLLSSVLWHFKAAFEYMVEGIDKGTFGEKPYVLTTANRGITLLDTPNIPSKVWSEVSQVEKKIISGELKVPLAKNIGEVKKMIEG